MTRSLHLTVLLALACIFTLSCQTYVNIPKQSGDTANHNPNGKTVRKVMVQAIKAALIDGGITGPVQIMLPAKAKSTTYIYVALQVGDQAILPDDDSMTAVEGVVFAKNVRIRGHLGEVDVIRPYGDGIDQLVTVSLKWKAMGGWQATGVRVWRGVPIDD